MANIINTQILYGLFIFGKNAFLAKNGLKNPYFWNLKIWFVAEFGRKSADMWPEGPLSPQVSPKFFLSETDKNSWFYPKKMTPPTKGYFCGGVRSEIVRKDNNVLTWQMGAKEVDEYSWVVGANTNHGCCFFDVCRTRDM